MGSSLHLLGLKHGTDKATAHNYLDFYEKFFNGFRFRPSNILEIGVHNGASLKMWRDYFPACHIYGIDIKPALAIEGCRVLQIDATDIYAMADVFRNVQFDLIIDDGSHFCRDQQTSFFYLYNFHLKEQGYYVIEDIHTSFIPTYKDSKFTTYEIVKMMYPHFEEYWDKGNHTDSGTVVIQKM